VNAVAIHEDREDRSNDYRTFYSITLLSPWRCVQDGRPAGTTYQYMIPVAPHPPNRQIGLLENFGKLRHRPYHQKNMAQ